jgi:hypothetical protein
MDQDLRDPLIPLGGWTLRVIEHYRLVELLGFIDGRGLHDELRDHKVVVRLPYPVEDG